MSYFIIFSLLNFCQINYSLILSFLFIKHCHPSLEKTPLVFVCVCVCVCVGSVWWFRWGEIHRTFLLTEKSSQAETIYLWLLQGARLHERACVCVCVCVCVCWIRLLSLGVHCVGSSGFSVGDVAAHTPCCRGEWPSNRGLQWHLIRQITNVFDPH